MKKLLVLVMALTMTLTFASCGEKSDSGSDDKKSTVKTSVNSNGVVEIEEKVKAETVTTGNTITVDFAEITIDEAAIADDIQTSITSGYITYTSGPQAQEDTEFVYIRGTIKNTSKSEINMVNIEGKAEIDGYTYEIEDIDIIESDGSSVYSIAPLKSYNYTLYAEVPNELALNGSPCTVNFGFKDNFEYVQTDETTPYNYSMVIEK